MAMEKARKEEIEGWLAALRDREGLTRERAREHLVSLGQSATPLLLPLLSDRDAQTRWEAAKALSEIADPAAIPSLIATLEDEDTDVRWLAAEGLVAIGPPTARPLLRALIDRVKSVSVREGTHHVLRELRETAIGDDIADVYAALSKTYSNAQVVDVAEKALKRLKPTAEQ
jgi:HEAT repeat protein